MERIFLNLQFSRFIFIRCPPISVYMFNSEVFFNVLEILSRSRFIALLTNYGTYKNFGSGVHQEFKRFQSIRVGLLRDQSNKEIFKTRPSIFRYSKTSTPSMLLDSEPTEVGRYIIVIIFAMKLVKIRKRGLRKTLIQYVIHLYTKMLMQSVKKN